MRRASGALLVFTVLCASGGAAAQVPAPAITQALLSTDAFSRLDCPGNGAVAPVQLTIDTTDAIGSSRTFRATVFEDLPPTGGRIECPENLTGSLVTQSIPVESARQTIQLQPVQLIGAARCEGPGERVGDAALCVFIDNADRRPVSSVGIPITFDTQVPPDPTIESLTGGDGRFTVTFGDVVDEFGDVYDFIVQYRPCEVLGDGGTPDAGAEDGDGGTTGLNAESTCGAPGPYTAVEENRDPVNVTGLENGVEYEVRVMLRDDFGNESEPSEPALVTPLPGLGPLDFYNGAGTPYSMMPSCGATSGNAPWAMGLVGLLALAGVSLRRRRHRSGARSRGALFSLALLPALFGALPSQAQLFELTDDPLENGSVTLSLFGGPYHPGIDNERVGGGTIFPIYDCFFDDATLVELGGSLDYHLVDIFGSLQAGVGVSATQAKGFAVPISAAGTGACGEKTDDSVELTILKVTPQLTYRLDPLLDWVGFPLVPYGRLGVVGAGYAFTKGGLFPEAPTEAQNPVGLVLGWEAAGGLMLAMDFWDYLDPFSRWGTKRARARGVFSHAFIYGEAVWQPIDNFGQPSLVLSPTDPFTGTQAPWTVHFGVAVELL